MASVTSSGFDGDAWDNSYRERHQKVVEQTRNPDDIMGIRNVLQKQDQDLKQAVEKDLPLEPLLRSFGLDASTIAEIQQAPLSLAPKMEQETPAPVSERQVFGLSPPRSADDLFAKLRENARDTTEREQTREKD